MLCYRSISRCLFRSTLITQTRCSHLKVPSKSTWKDFQDDKELPQVPEITKKQIDQLERLGLVELNNEDGIKNLTEAIRYANRLHFVNTDGVKPLDTVLEDLALYIRDDVVTEGDCKTDILMNAKKTEEDYFVAPPGNIPLNPKEKSVK